MVASCTPNPLEIFTYLLQLVVCGRHAVLQLLHAGLLPAVEAELGDGARHQEPVITEPRYVNIIDSIDRVDSVDSVDTRLPLHSPLVRVTNSAMLSATSSRL